MKYKETFTTAIKARHSAARFGTVHYTENSQ